MYKLFVYNPSMNTLKKILEKEQIKIADFARGISATSQQVCNWFDRGNIPKNFIIPISKFLNMPLEEAIKLKASDVSITNNETKGKV